MIVVESSAGEGKVGDGVKEQRDIERNGNLMKKVILRNEGLKGRG